MTVFASSRCLLKFAGPLLAVLVAGFVSLGPSSAAASCGDWLDHPSQTVERRNLTDDSTPSPCENGECRRDGSELPFAPPTLLKLSTDRSACLGRTPAVSNAKSDRVATEPQVGEPKFVPFVPERPPRI